MGKKIMPDMPAELLKLAKAVKNVIKKILLIDDSYFALDYFSHIIQLLDPEIKILGATNTEQAKNIFLENADTIDVVLMDYRLADTASGSRLTKNFLILRPDLQILANSALDDFNQKLIENGATEIIKKNVSVKLTPSCSKNHSVI